MTRTAASPPLETDTNLSKAQHYLDMATHIRDLAAQESNDGYRAIMVTLAEQYEDLCRHFMNYTE